MVIGEVKPIAQRGLKFQVDDMFTGQMEEQPVSVACLLVSVVYWSEGEATSQCSVLIGLNIQLLARQPSSSQFSVLIGQNIQFFFTLQFLNYYKVSLKYLIYYICYVLDAVACDILQEICYRVQYQMILSNRSIARILQDKWWVMMSSDNQITVCLPAMNYQ